MNLLSVAGVTKRYFHYTSQWRRIASWFFPAFKPKEAHTIFENITFSMKPGETIAIVGQNGAGKSTLLKMIVGIISPTEGSIERQGNVAAILELGMGFSPELTGRDNALHTASLMGHSRQDIEAVIESIRDFAELGDYFDEPIRVYSSGMQMRLAFAVATAFTPDLLIIDEALSVGDTYFQHKSFDRIRSLQSQGTSLLFVSHDMQAIMSLCTRALLIEQGKLLLDADPESVMNRYNLLIAQREEEGERHVRHVESTIGIAGTGEAVTTSVGMFDALGNIRETFETGEGVTLSVEVSLKAPVPRLVFGFMIKDRTGQPVFGTNTWHTSQILYDLHEGDAVRFEATFPLDVGPGDYSLSTALVSGDTHLEANYEWRDRAMIFAVVNTSHPYFIGTAALYPKISIEKVPTC